MMLSSTIMRVTNSGCKQNGIRILEKKQQTTVSSTRSSKWEEKYKCGIL